MTNLSFFCDLRDRGIAVYEVATGSRDANRTKVCVEDNKEQISVYIYTDGSDSKKKEVRQGGKATPSKDAKLAAESDRDEVMNKGMPMLQLDVKL